MTLCGWSTATMEIEMDEEGVRVARVASASASGSQTGSSLSSGQCCRSRAEFIFARMPRPRARTLVPFLEVLCPRWTRLVHVGTVTHRKC